jgi:hypothetical protein
MTEDFSPIHSQEMFDQRIKSRLTREQERMQKDKEAAVADLQKQLEEKDRLLADYEERLAKADEEAQAKAEAVRTEKDKELADVRADYHREAAARAVREHLKGIGVDDRGRQDRILKYADLGEVSLDDHSTITQSLVSVRNDLPELFEGYRLGGSGSRGSEKPVIEPEKPLTREEIEAMSPEEQCRPGMKERIDAFLRGERG